MEHTREAITTILAERLCWQVAQRDDVRVARRLYRKQVVDECLTARRLRRLLKASYWSVCLLVEWLAYEMIHTFWCNCSGGRGF
jgi:hypothetical protein